MSRRTLLLGLSVFIYTTAPSQWVQQSSGTSNTLSSVFFVDVSNGWIAGAAGILHTTDGGNTWKPQGGSGLVTIQFTDTSNGWACGGSSLLHTTNGGSQWNPQTTGFTVTPYASVSFGDANNGRCVGRRWLGGNTGLCTILRTQDRGLTWINQTTFGSKYYEILQVQSYGADRGWVLITIDSASIGRTINGASWYYANVGDAHAHAFHFPDSLNGWVVRDAGGILHTVDGGAHWVQQTTGTIQNLQSVYFANASNGWVVGTNGLILRTSDGGDHWTQQTSGTSQRLLSVSFPDANNGWAVGEGGVILRTTDGGAIVPPVLASPSSADSNQPLDPTLSWRAVVGAISYHVQVSSDPLFGTMILDLPALIDTSVVVEGLAYDKVYYWHVRSNAISASSQFSQTWTFKTRRLDAVFGFSLKQNYPNPFSSTTEIEFELPWASSVVFTVHNSLGQQVAIITREYPLPGLYHETFSGTRLASGSYFYSIDAGTLFYVRQMVLVK